MSILEELEAWLVEAESNADAEAKGSAADEKDYEYCWNYGARYAYREALSHLRSLKNSTTKETP